MYQLNLILTQAQLDTLSSLLEEQAVAQWSQFIEKGPKAGLWEFQALFQEKPDPTPIQKVIGLNPQITSLRKKNWLKECYKSFPPIVIGSFVAYSDTNPTIPPDKIPLKIEAATAFGTGRHGTTNGCLMALSELNASPKSALDMGCGSGILSIAYAKLTGNHADAVDLDPESVRVTRQNTKQNGVARLVHTWKSDGYQNVTDTYDLIFCNILAQPAIEMAPLLSQHLNAGGYAIISGFLLSQEAEVVQAHTNIGLKLLKKYKWDEWGTVTLYKPEKPSKSRLHKNTKAKR